MNEIILTTLRTRITAVYPTQIRAAVEPLTDEQLWWRPNEGSNSIGNLIVHLTGSLNYFLNRNLGGIAFDRDREAEFAERRMLPKAQVLAAFDEMIARAERTFAALTPERLNSPSPEPKMSTIVVEDLINIATHVATHTGQIVWIAKMFDGDALHEIWIKSHRAGGTWKGA